MIFVVQKSSAGYQGQFVCKDLAPPKLFSRASIPVEETTGYFRPQNKNKSAVILEDDGAIELELFKFLLIRSTWGSKG